MRAFLGGTFDPVHVGHLHAAAAGGAALGVAKVTLVLSARPPHRAQPAATFEDRWQMLKIAVDDHPALVASDLELGRSGPSYTIDTVAALAADGDDPVVWMFGADGIPSFRSWHRWRDLPRFCHFLVFARPGSPMAELPGFETARDAAELEASAAGKALLLETPMLDVSATEVRRRIAAGRDVSTLVPAGVWTYITERELYQS